MSFLMNLPFVAKLAIPLIAGGLTGSIAMAGVVYTQTKAPDTNPASTPILTYGDEA
ncbi:MAG: hypothetical protein JWM84_857 [Nocardioides sp.]|nr:hypothetical protein [Nocardioides sp.]